MSRRLRKPNAPAVPATIRRTPTGRERKRRVRSLVFELCETRLPLAVLHGDWPSIDIRPVDESPSVEIAAASCQATSALVVGDVSSSDKLDRCDRLPVSDESPAEPAVAPADSEDESVWLTLDADTEPVWLAERFDTPLSPNDEAMYAELAARLGAMQGSPLNSAESDRTGRVRPEVSSGNTGSPPANASNLEGERRDWTSASIVRYPLQFPHAAGRPLHADDAASPAPTLASSAGFVDIGRLTASTRPLRQLDATSSESGEIARRDALIPSLTPDPLAGTAVRSNAPQSSRTNAFSNRSSLVGENRSQRLMLLVSIGSRPRQPNEVSPLPMPIIETETPQVRVDRDLPSGVAEKPENDRSATVGRPHVLGTLPVNSQAAEPPADVRVSRSAINGLATALVLAAGLFRKARKSQNENATFWNDALFEPSP